ncbi:hypothetical protein B9Z55_023996 [Caenorhabditis nigoni]|uniref:Uncharacterized protein n=1 Tax=Caenorhabditis nigoni TaxID=1611254 RepID=A0A2G5SS95_9PELO|nr:hypothetical protein B9Z55_023996 [Caenorhabditis nigoni]
MKKSVEYKKSSEELCIAHLKFKFQSICGKMKVELSLSTSPWIVTPPQLNEHCGLTKVKFVLRIKKLAKQNLKKSFEGSKKFQSTQ